MLQRLSALLAGLLLLATFARADDRGWIEESNKYAQVLLEVLAKYNPESATSLGVEGHEAEVVDLKPQYDERQEADLAAAAAEAQSRAWRGFRSAREAGHRHPHHLGATAAQHIGAQPATDAWPTRT